MRTWRRAAVARFHHGDALHPLVLEILMKRCGIALLALALSAPADSSLQRGIEGARLSLEIGDKVYTDVVARSAPPWVHPSK